MNEPNSVTFEEFFERGQDETISPFIQPTSRKWSINLTLKTASIAAVLLLLAFALSFSPSLLPLSHFVLVTVYFLVGIPSLIEAIEDLVNLDVNIDILMTLAAFSSIFIGSGMEGALLLVLFALSGAMEDAVTRKAQGSISHLNKLSPTTAHLMEDSGRIIEKSVKDIPLNAKILVKAGQVVPLDGLVLEGTSSVNLVHLTGENFPVNKAEGDVVAAGARNLEGALVLKVTSTSANSTLAKIISLVTEAQDAKPRLQRWFDQLSRSYALGVIGLSALFALSFPYLLHISFLGPEGSIYRALAFLIAASPCALIIAIPIAYLSAISTCANRGILLKGGITLDALSHCRAIAFDKTGTLTTGELRLEKQEAYSEETFSLEKALQILYALEINAVHPIAKAIVVYCEKQNLSPAKLQNFKSIPGYGLQGEILINEIPLAVFAGNEAFIRQQLKDPAKLQWLEERAEQLKAKGYLLTVLLIGQEIFLFEFRDVLRPNMKSTIEQLKKHYGFDLFMLTGDHRESAERIAKEIGIDDYFAELKPEDKFRLISDFSANKGLAMVGDGVNDAPALARASVGICMGKVGTTTAMDAADVILLQDNIELLDWLFKKAYQTRAIVKQNLSIAVLAILFAAFPALAGYVPLWLAVVMHEGGTVLVGLNALRLLRH